MFTKSSLFLILYLTCINVQSQDKSNFQKDPETNKFTLTQIVETPGKTKRDLIEAIKQVGMQLVSSAFDKKEKGVLTKNLNVYSANNDPYTDSSRLLFKAQISQISKTNMKISGYQSYINLTMDIFFFIKDEKFKIELTNFTVSGGDVKLSGSMDALEEKNSNSKNWQKTKEEIYQDGLYVKEKFANGILTYFRKSDF